MEIKRPLSSAHEQVCSTCAAISLAGDFAEPAVRPLQQAPCQRRPVFVSNIYTSYLGLCTRFKAWWRSDTVVKECLCDYWTVGMRLAAPLNEKER